MQNSKSTASLFLFAAFVSYLMYIFHSLAVRNFIKEVMELLTRFIV